MGILAKIVGVAIIFIGAIVLVKPAVFGVILNFWKKDKNVYLAGVIRLTFGAIFLLAASSCRLPVVITVFGVLMIIGGILIFALGPKRLSAIFDWWQNKPAFIVRLLGFVAFAMGSLIVYSI
jgi:hypothetical protein